MTTLNDYVKDCQFNRWMPASRRLLAAAMTLADVRVLVCDRDPAGYENPLAIVVRGDDVSLEAFHPFAQGIDVDPAEVERLVARSPSRRNSLERTLVAVLGREAGVEQ